MGDKLFTYIRVSTDRQVDKCTYENQEVAIKKFLKGRDVEIIAEFQDLGLSGASRDRPGFNEMFSRLDEVDGICVYDDDRLARDFDMSIEQMFTLKKLKKKLYIARKCKVIDFDKQREEQLIHLISGWVAEQEREKIKQRQVDGMKRYRENNGTWGRPKKKINWKQYDEYKAVGLSDHAISKIFQMDWRTLKERVKER